MSLNTLIYLDLMQVFFLCCLVCCSLTSVFVRNLFFSQFLLVEDMVYYGVREEGTITALNISNGEKTELFSDGSLEILSISASLHYIYFTTWNEK